jgi:hypothetical protein
MIEQTIIRDATSNLLGALESRHQITPDLSVLSSVFPRSVITKINDYILNTPNKPWQLETTEHGVEMDVPRHKISWHSDTVVEELHCAVENITPQVQAILEKPVKFHGIVLWQDHKNYLCDWHSDNPILMATMQIYLAGSTENPGTMFKLNDREHHTCPFVPNTGYLLNQTQNRLLHRSVEKVPANISRYSLFGMWVTKE